MAPRVVSTPTMRLAFAQEAGHLAVLDDVDTAIARGARIAPDDGIVPGRAAARLQEPALDRETRIVEVEKRQPAAYAIGIEQLGIDAMQAHGVAATGEGVALGVGMAQVDDAALAHHDVVVEVLLQALPELHRPLVERLVARQQVIRADDRGVAARIARADPAPLHHGDVRDAVVLREVIGRGEPVPAAADDHDVVARLRSGIAPQRSPATMAGKRLADEGDD